MEKSIKVAKQPKKFTRLFLGIKPGLMSNRQRFFGTRKRTITSIIVLLIVIFIIWRILGGQKTTPQYQTATVTSGTIISSVSESGNVSAGNQINVTSPADGVITNIYVKNGDQVSTGENLFAVKATATPQEQATAYANYLSAQNTLNAAQAKINSLQAALFTANQTFVNDQGNNPSDAQKQSAKYIEENATWLQAQADYNNQAGVIAQAQAALNAAGLAYQETQSTTVTAPTDGTVANLTANLGGNVTASSQTAAGSSTNASGTSNSNSGAGSSTSNASSSTPVLVIANFTQLLVKVAASEVDLPNLKPGQKVTLTLDAFPGKTFVGTVNNIDSIGTVSSGVVTYNVYISFDYAPPGVQPGMSATASIQTAKKDNVLMVPSAAVQTNNGEFYVRVLKNGQISQALVTTGISSETDTEITSGLSAGETVVTGITTPGSSTSSNSSSPFSGRGFGGGGIFRAGGGGGGNGGGARGQ